jgi:hypothetical protein
MTGVLVTLIVLATLSILAVVTVRVLNGPRETPRRRQYLRMLHGYREARLTALEIQRIVRSWRPSLDEAGVAFANEVQEQLDKLNRRSLELELKQKIEEDDDK